MPTGVKFQSKIFLLTPRCAAQRGVNSALCRIAGSRDSVLCHIARSLKKSFICDSALRHLVWNSSQKFSCRLCTMRHSAESTNFREFLCEFTTICKNILTRWSVTQVGLIHEKTKGRKSRETVPLRSLYQHNFQVNRHPVSYLCLACEGPSPTYSWAPLGSYCKDACHIYFF
jgi:hypothetical protein